MANLDRCFAGNELDEVIRALPLRPPVNCILYRRQHDNAFRHGFSRRGMWGPDLLLSVEELEAPEQRLIAEFVSR